MAETKIEKCAHPGCNCPAAKGNKYCGAYCEGAGKSPSFACVITPSALLARRLVRRDKPSQSRCAFLGAGIHC
jgi:hypothetical protein